MKFSGSITYILATDEGNRVKFEVQAMSALTKGTLEYPATPDWQTVWRLYNDRGNLIWEDARHHSIMPFSQADSAVDDFNFEVAKDGTVYTFQLFGRISGQTQFITQQSVNILTNSIVATPTPVPLPPTTVPLPETPPGEISIPAIAGISAGVVLVGVIILLLLLRR